MCVPTRTIGSAHLVGTVDTFVAEGLARKRQREQVAFVNFSHNGGEGIGTEREHLWTVYEDKKFFFVMELVEEWLRQNMPTAILKAHAGDGYRGEDDAWYEPIHKTKANSDNLNSVTTFKVLDVHNLHSVFEEIEHEGQVFWIAKALIFNAQNHAIKNGRVEQWADSHDMELQVLPQELSKHPSRTFCIAKARNRCHFAKTFRAWLIANRYDINKGRSLCDGATGDFRFFYDIFFCHDHFFTTLGLHSEGLRELYEYHYTDGDDPACIAEVKRLWSKYLWARYRNKIRLIGRIALFFKLMYIEISLRPEHSGAKDAHRHFQACADTLELA